MIPEAKICIGLLTHCKDENSKRFEILKKSVDTLSIVKKQRDDVFLYVWDNNSSEGVKEYLKSKSFFDFRYFSKKNLYDVVAVNFLAEKAKQLKAEYVCHLEDDFYFYDEDFLDSCFKFLDTNLDCGYLRIIKYEYDKKELYDKFWKQKEEKDERKCFINFLYVGEKDSANGQRHFNTITNDKLIWEGPEVFGEHRFYKNNWHWHNYANICRTDVFDKIIPKKNYRPLQKLEGYMMKKYNSLDLKVGVLDKGATTHLGNFNENESQRVKVFKDLGLELNAKLPIISYKEIEEEINIALGRET